jgi:hypothetical protein
MNINLSLQPPNNPGFVYLYRPASICTPKNFLNVHYSSRPSTFTHPSQLSMALGLNTQIQGSASLCHFNQPCNCYCCCTRSHPAWLRQQAVPCHYPDIGNQPRSPYFLSQTHFFQTPVMPMGQYRSLESLPNFQSNSKLNSSEATHTAFTSDNKQVPEPPTPATDIPPFSAPESNITVPQSFEAGNDLEPDTDGQAIPDEPRRLVRTPSENSGVNTPCNFSLIKGIMYQYFFEDSVAIPNLNLNPLELSALKVLLIKKLVHDKKKSRMYYMIRNLVNDDLYEFLESNPALNRKNIIKSNIFKRVWKVLEKREKGRFATHYFSESFDRFPRETFSIKHYRKHHSFNLSDEFYARCLESTLFRLDYFEVLADAKFRESLLQHSKLKFLNSFDYWMSETMIFLHKGKSPFERQNKLPDFKYGTSFKDLELAASLFKKLIQKE